MQDVTMWPIVMESVDAIITALEAALRKQRVCISYYDDSHRRGPSVLIDLELDEIELELPATPGGQAYLLLYFRGSDGWCYQHDVDFNVTPFLPSTLTIEPGVIRIIDYKDGYSDCEPIIVAGWTTFTWIPQQDMTPRPHDS